MKRDLAALGSQLFDVLIIGGGAFGAAAAWDATLRGLSVALIDKADFAAGASAECFKMVHGGIRYLQHADLKRMRFSCAQRAAFLRIAPHLVAPLPIVIPTYGHGRRSKPLLAAGMFAYDLLTAGRNANISDRSRRISRTQLLSRRETLELFPEIEDGALTGSAVFEDGQMYNPPRLVLAFVQSAVGRGAVAANYVEAIKFLWSGDTVCGASVVDAIGGDRFDVRAKLVLNAAGPWADYMLGDSNRFPTHVRGHFSRDACFLVDRKPRSCFALAVPGWSKDRDALVSRPARHLFAVPWRDCTLIGVWHRLFSQRPEVARVEEAELAIWIDEMNAGYPALRLRREDVIYANCGLVPFGEGAAAADELSFGKESRLIDHRAHGVHGLVTLIGIRYTTALGDAAAALDKLLEQWPSAPGRGPSDAISLKGGDFASFSALQGQARQAVGGRVTHPTLEHWLRNHGTGYAALASLTHDEDLARPLGESDTVVAEVHHAVREEMAVRLADVVLRRTNLGSGHHPGHAAVMQAAGAMQPLMGWNDACRDAEIAHTERMLADHHAARPASAPS